MAISDCKEDFWITICWIESESTSNDLKQYFNSEFFIQNFWTIKIDHFNCLRKILVRECSAPSTERAFSDWTPIRPVLKLLNLKFRISEQLCFNLKHFEVRASNLEVRGFWRFQMELQKWKFEIDESHSRSKSDRPAYRIRTFWTRN